MARTFARNGVNRKGFFVWPEKPARMGPERQQRERPPLGIGPRARGRDDHLMPAVQTIEVANRNDRAVRIGGNARNVAE